MLGDFPLTAYTFPAKVVLILGIFMGLCLMATFVGIFSSGLVNFLSADRNEELIAITTKRMAAAWQVAMKLQLQYRRRRAKRLLDEKRAEAGLAVSAPPLPPPRPQLTWWRRLRRDAQALVGRTSWRGVVVMTFFSCVLVVNV